MDAAIAQFAHDTIVALWPHQATSVDQELQAQLAEIPDGDAKANGIALGKRTVQDILVARANDDGSEVLRNVQVEISA